jgi:hypothetical protein
MMFLSGSTNPRPKWFVRKLASLGPEYSELREGVMSWMYGERRAAAQKREAIATACDLIDMTYAHVRALLDTNAKYFAAEEALAITEREFAERATRDRDTMAEWQLRRRVFTDSERPMKAQIQSYSGEA